MKNNNSLFIKMSIIIITDFIRDYIECLKTIMINVA